MTEHALDVACRNELKRRGAWGYKTTGVAEAGIPDRHYVYRGYALVLELKAGKGRVRPKQAYHLKRAAQAGAVARVIRTITELRQLLDDLDQVILASRHQIGSE